MESTTRISGSQFQDEYGRTLMFRGVNVSASSKLPSRPEAATYHTAGLYDHHQVSFVGRPFPLSEADEHFRRLRAWGFRLLRLPVTWEAIEHAGPGIYDQEYLDYLCELVRLAGEYGFRVLIDPHQDVWSRFTGGDGAPGWTLDAVGFDMSAFPETEAAIVQATYLHSFMQMIWLTNIYKLAPATMFTLFFAGNDFAPQTKIGGMPVQEYLQDHYVHAFEQVARRVATFSNVIGFEAMNEPIRGFINMTRLDHMASPYQAGVSPTPYQAMLLASGFPQVVDIMQPLPTGSIRTGQKLLNENRRCAWDECAAGIWRQHGVWDVGSDGQPCLLRPDYFTKVNGQPVDFGQDYLRPFVNHFARAIRSAAPDMAIGLHTEIGQLPPLWSQSDAANIFFSPHWYDVFVQITKRYSPWLCLDLKQSVRLVIGAGRVEHALSGQLERYRRQAEDRLGDCPIIIGETGIPFDIHQKNAFRTGKFGSQVKALDRSLRAIEKNLLSYCLWNYNPENTNARGDHWNDEDLSIFSRDQQTDPQDLNSGGRALNALLRPQAQAVAGKPVSQSFDLLQRRYDFAFQHTPGVDAPSEFYVPNWHYPGGYRVEVSDGDWKKDEANQQLSYYHGTNQPEHWIRLTPVS